MAVLTVTVLAGYDKQITIPATSVDASWVVYSTHLDHTINIKSVVHKKRDDLVIGKLYRISYEVYDHVSCTVYLKMGTKEGTVRNANGVYHEDMVVEFESDKVISFVSDGILKIRNITYEEKIVETTPVSFSDPTKFQNKSWTLSFSLYTKTWVSYHSYLPLYYIHNQSSLYSFEEGSSNIWKHNIEGLFQNYYGKKYPSMLEYVSISKDLGTKISEDMTLITKARKWNATEGEYNDERFITFNKMVAYNDRASTGEQEIIVKDTMAQPEDWYFHQIVNTPNQILATRRERNWNLNQIRNYVVDSSVPIFTSAWSKIQDEYPIDKVVNESNIDINTEWNDTEMLRDKFIIIRMKFDTFDDVNLIFNFSLETEQVSNR